MNETYVSEGPESVDVLQRLTDEWNELTPEAQKAARYVLENPQAVGVSTVREIAESADVKPNTFMRMARAIGFDGFEDFREPFREAIRQGTVTFQDRARWLQEIGKAGEIGALYADMVASALRNIEETFSGIDAERLRAAAATISNARQVYALGVGVNSSIVRNFAYIASTGMVQFHPIPRLGSNALDDLAGADGRDALLAVTCRPYRTEVVGAVEQARYQGVGIIGISDSPASPVVRAADHGFAVAIDTPQFFPSSVALIALLETILSFVISAGSPQIVNRVEEFHARRHELGIYSEEDA